MRIFNKKIFVIIPILVTLLIQYTLSNIGPISWFPFGPNFHEDLGNHITLIREGHLQSFLKYPAIFHFPLSILNLSFHELLIGLYVLMYLLLAVNMYLFMHLSQSDLANVLFAVNPFFPLLLMAGAYSQLASVSIILIYFMTENEVIKIISLGLLIYGYPLALVVIVPLTLVRREWKVLSSTFVLSIPYIYLATYKIKEVMYLSTYINIDTPPFFFESLIWSQPIVNFLVFAFIPLLFISLSLTVLIERSHISASLISIPVILWILLGLGTGMGVYFIYKVVYYLPISLADVSYDQESFGKLKKRFTKNVR